MRNRLREFRVATSINASEWIIMRIAKVVIGILSVYMAAGILLAGLTGMITRKDGCRGTIVSGIIFLIPGITVLFSNIKLFQDLLVWAFLSIIIGVTYICVGVKEKNEEEITHIYSEEER